MAEKMSDVIALKKFFGFKQGQTLKEFNEELKALSPEEKRELADGARTQLGEVPASVAA